MTWQSIAQQKQADRDNKIPQDWRVQVDKDLLDVTGVPLNCGILNDLEKQIVQTSAPDIVSKMISKQWSSVQVTTAFCKTAAIAQQLTNCLTEIMFDQALKRAKELDEHLAKTGKPVGSLHGLPVSIKDQFNIEGVDTTVGYVAWANKPATKKDESELIKILRDAGAVFYCKTTIPTAMMIPESYNNTFGYCTNPYNRKLTCGGSSGGEGALQAMYGSPVGVSSDIGGSTRIPSAACHVYGLKPSIGRFPTYGAKSGLPGQEGIGGVNGPMARSIEALELYSAAVVDGKPWLYDPKMLPIPWDRNPQVPEKLCFGYIKDDMIVHPHPPVQRALKETLDKLRAAGHEIIEWEPIKHAEGLDIIAKCFTSDGGKHVADALAESGEPWPVGLSAYRDTVAPLSGYDMWKIQSARTSFAKDVYDRWNATSQVTSTGRPIDGIISPVMPFASCPHYKFEHIGYTGIWNLCDMPSVVFPVLQADPAIDVPEQGYKPRSDLDERIHRMYDTPEDFRGGPVGLQIIGRKLTEENTLALAKKIVSCLV